MNDMKKTVLKEKKDRAERIRKIRIACGYSQENMADMFEISLSAYKKIESAENNISLKALRILKEQLDVSSDYILYGEEKDFEQTWLSYSNCNRKDKIKMFLKIINYFSNDSINIRNENNLNKEELVNIINQLFE